MTVLQEPPLDSITVEQPVFEIVVYGTPAPQGSKRHVGRGVMVESSKKVKPWRDDVRAAALTAKPAGWRPLDDPLAAQMVFTLRKPLSAPKKRRTWPCKYPDISKLIRSTEDALTSAGVWTDDARVVEYRHAAKVFPLEDIDALEAPGAVIRIWRIGGADMRPPTNTEIRMDGYHQRIAYGRRIHATREAREEATP